MKHNLAALLAIVILNYGNCLTIDSILTSKTAIIINEQKNQSKLNQNQWFNLIEYAHQYILKNRNSVIVEKNESGFYRINIKAPEHIIKNYDIDKLRIHYWPMDKSNYIRDESIHNHPKYFESLIINGGYKHSIYRINNESSSPSAKKFNFVRINKQNNGLKSFTILGEVYVNKIKDEMITKGTVVVMNTNIIHKVLFSIPGSLSMNVVYKDPSNKSYYHVVLNKNSTENNVITTRDKANDKNKILNEINCLLLDKLSKRN